MQTATAPLPLSLTSTAAGGIASLRIRDEAAEKPGARRKIVAACLVGAVAIHGALAFVPLDLGGSAAQYGIASGDQIEITLLVENEEPSTAAAEPMPAVEPQPSAVPDAAPEFQMPALEEAVAATAVPVAPPARPVQQARPTATAAPIAAAKPSARSGGNGERTMAKANYLRNPPPKYPAESRKLREQGVVLLKVSVTAEGRAGDVQLQRSSGFPRLDEAAIRAVRRWEFSPARVGTAPVASAVEVPVRFGLN